jgi:hypothetical protein
MVVVAVLVDMLVAVELSVALETEVLEEEAPCEGSRKLTPRPRPNAESIAITAPTAICLLSWDISKSVSILYLGF